MFFFCRARGSRVFLVYLEGHTSFILNKYKKIVFAMIPNIPQFPIIFHVGQRHWQSPFCYVLPPCTSATVLRLGVQEHEQIPSNSVRC